jgi:peptidoglycan hydrolase CwlO-like protein
MAFEFSNKIEQLTNKLQHIKEHNNKDSRIDEAKQQLKTLQHSINKELAIAEKRIRKI